MSLPTGSWDIITDGLGSGVLTIDSVDSSGNVSGTTTIPGDGTVVGFFDATSQTVNLSNVTSPTTEFYVFSAALFQATSGTTKTQTTTDSILAGTYEAYPPDVAAPATGRWVAALNQKVKEKDKEEKDKEQSKDTKDVKDHKDTVKETVPDKIRPPDKIQAEIQPAVAPGDMPGLLQQLTMRLDAIEGRLATGQSFIPAEERPGVGDQTLRETEDR
jgi:hypothetical protein